METNCTRKLGRVGEAECCSKEYWPFQGLWLVHISPGLTLKSLHIVHSVYWYLWVTYNSYNKQQR